MDQATENTITLSPGALACLQALKEQLGPHWPQQTLQDVANWAICVAGVRLANQLREQRAAELARQEQEAAHAA